MDDIKTGDFHFSDFGQYKGCFIIHMSYRYIVERGLEFFFVADKKVALEGRQIKPTDTIFRTLERF